MTNNSLVHPISELPLFAVKTEVTVYHFLKYSSILNPSMLHLGHKMKLVRITHNEEKGKCKKRELGNKRAGCVEHKSDE